MGRGGRAGCNIMVFCSVVSGFPDFSSVTHELISGLLEMLFVRLEAM